MAALIPDWAASESEIFGEFQAKILASSSNELQELFRKYQTGMTGWPSGNILDFRARLPERNCAKRPP